MMAKPTIGSIEMRRGIIAALMMLSYGAGIASAEDAIAFLLCGASAVQVGTISYVNPGAVAEMRSGIEAYLERHEIPAVRELTGALELPAR